MKIRLETPADYREVEIQSDFSVTRPSGRKVFFQRFHIVTKGFLACRIHLAGSAGHLALEALLHRDIDGVGGFVYLHAEVPGGGTRLFLQIGEIGFIHSGQDAHHRQPEFGMKERI